MLDGRVPRMLFDRSQIYKMQQRTDRRINRIVQFAALLIRQAHSFDEWRRTLQILLKEHRRINAARVTLQDSRPVLEEGKNVRREPEVITKEIELGNLLRWPIDAIDVGERHVLPVNFQNQIALGFLQREKLLARSGRAFTLARALAFRRILCSNGHTC